MNQRDRDLLRKNRVYLVRNLIVEEELLSFLGAKRILSEDMAEEIQVGSKTKAAKAGALLDILPRRGPKAFRGFIEGLVESDQGYIGDLLDNSLANEYRQVSGRPLEEGYPEDTPVHREMRPLREQFKNTKVEDTESFIKFEIKNVDVIDARRKNDDTANYPMKAKPRGRAIILNIDHFSKSQHSNRYGSQFDVVNLTELFKNLHFDVKLWSNLNREKILANIREEQSADHHAAADAFVMIILSHGHEGIIYAEDGVEIDIEKEIVNQFSGTKCRNLINKPKMFFIQACQGKGKTTGVVADGTESDATEADAKMLADLEKELSGGEDTSDSVKQRLENMTHEMSDILVAYSTVPGYKAWRHTSLGSWFMRDLVTVFAQYCHMEHVMDMLTRVNKLVDERVVEGDHYRQICRHVSQLRRRVFLLPGYFKQ